MNVVGSSIAREADNVLYTWAGPEIAVATTKAYSTQLALMDMIALYLGDLLGTVSREEYTAILHELETLPEKLQTVHDPANSPESGQSTSNHWGSLLSFRKRNWNMPHQNPHAGHRLWYIEVVSVKIPPAFFHFHCRSCQEASAA